MEEESALLPGPRSATHSPPSAWRLGHKFRRALADLVDGTRRQEAHVVRPQRLEMVENRLGRLLTLRDVGRGGLLARLARVEWLTMLTFLYGDEICTVSIASRWTYDSLRAAQHSTTEDVAAVRGLWRFLLRRDFSKLTEPHMMSGAARENRPPSTLAHLMNDITEAEAELIRDDLDVSHTFSEELLEEDKYEARMATLTACCESCELWSISATVSASKFRTLNGWVPASQAPPKQCMDCGAWHVTDSRRELVQSGLVERLGFAFVREPSHRDVALCHALVDSMFICGAIAREARDEVRVRALTRVGGSSTAALSSSSSAHKKTDDDAEGEDVEHVLSALAGEWHDVALEAREEGEEGGLLDLESGASLTRAMPPSEPLCRVYSDLAAIYAKGARATQRRRAKVAAPARQCRGRVRYLLCCFPVHCGSIAVPLVFIIGCVLCWLLLGVIWPTSSLRPKRRGESDDTHLASMYRHTAVGAMLLLPAFMLVVSIFILVCIAAPIRWICNTPRHSLIRRLCVRFCSDRSSWYDANELLFVESKAAKDASTSMDRNVFGLDRPTHRRFNTIALPFLHRGNRNPRADTFWRSPNMFPTLLTLPNAIVVSALAAYYHGVSLVTTLVCRESDAQQQRREASAKEFAIALNYVPVHQMYLLVFALTVLPLIAAKLVLWQDALWWSAPLAPIVFAVSMGGYSSQVQTMRWRLRSFENDADDRLLRERFPDWSPAPAAVERRAYTDQLTLRRTNEWFDVYSVLLTPVLAFIALSFALLFPKRVGDLMPKFQEGYSDAEKIMLCLSIPVAVFSLIVAAWQRVAMTVLQRLLPDEARSCLIPCLCCRWRTSEFGANLIIHVVGSIPISMLAFRFALLGVPSIGGHAVLFVLGLVNIILLGLPCLYAYAVAISDGHWRCCLRYNAFTIYAGVVIVVMLILSLIGAFFWSFGSSLLGFIRLQLALNMEQPFNPNAYLVGRPVSPNVPVEATVQVLFVFLVGMTLLGIGAVVLVGQNAAEKKWIFLGSIFIIVATVLVSGLPIMLAVPAYPCGPSRRIYGQACPGMSPIDLPTISAWANAISGDWHEAELLAMATNASNSGNASSSVLATVGESVAWKEGWGGACERWLLPLSWFAWLAAPCGYLMVVLCDGIRHDDVHLLGTAFEENVFREQPLDRRRFRF